MRTALPTVMSEGMAMSCLHSFISFFENTVIGDPVG
jgi:hypothetical protein